MPSCSTSSLLTLRAIVRGALVLRARVAAAPIAREAGGRAPRFGSCRAACGVLLAAVGCTAGESKPVAGSGQAGNASRAAAVPLPRDVTAPGIAVGASPYVVRAVIDGGRVTGTVRLTGALPADTSVTADSVAARVCGATFPDRTIAARGEAANRVVSGVVVWLADARSGKALPQTRRHTLALERCALAPRALAVASGGTLLVNGRDAMPSRLRVARFPAGAATGEIVLATRMTDAGQVVPSAAVLAQPGALEVRGEDHPWLRAWILAFDHPYFTTTDASGSFALDSVPAGTYTLVAWHERLGRVERKVVVGAEGGAVEVEFGGVGRSR